MEKLSRDLLHAPELAADGAEPARLRGHEDGAVVAALGVEVVLVRQAGQPRLLRLVYSSIIKIKKLYCSIPQGGAFTPTIYR